MNIEIFTLLTIVSAMVILFLSDKIPIDLTAFIGLIAITLCGYITTEEAFSGFSSSAVITMLCTFFVAAALNETGVTEFLGTKVEQLVGSQELTVVSTVMLLGVVISAFLPNVPTVAVLMPVVASISRRTGIAPSRLYLPMCFAVILGGSVTLIGCTPNIIAAEILQKSGYTPFQLFDFSLVAGIATACCLVAMALLGTRLLPSRELSKEQGTRDLTQLYRLHERLFSVRIPARSSLDGKTLGDIHFGRSLGVQVVSIMRQGKKMLAPTARDVLHAGDSLTVRGRHSELEILLRFKGVHVNEIDTTAAERIGSSLEAGAIVLSEGSALIGKTIRDISFRKNYGAAIIAIERGEQLLSSNLSRETLQSNDRLYTLSLPGHATALEHSRDFSFSSQPLSSFPQLLERLFLVEIPKNSKLAGMQLKESRMGELIGTTVAAVYRNDRILPPKSDTEIAAGDQLLVSGKRSQVQKLAQLGELRFEEDRGDSELESSNIGVFELALSPHSKLINKNLEDLNFRDRYGVQVLALWREGTPIRSHLARLSLRLGDALLVQGSHKKIELMAKDPDFLMLSESKSRQFRTDKAPYAIAALLLMVGLVAFKLQPIHFAAFTAASLVVLSGCLSMDEAYRAVSWRVVALIAALLPVGIALERTGAARLMAEWVIATAGPLGPVALIAGFGIFSNILSQALDGTVAVVLVAPIALQTAEQIGIAPAPLLMSTALSASMAFLTPVSHRANLLVMGAGGYSNREYFKLGGVITMVTFAVMYSLIPLIY